MPTFTELDDRYTDFVQSHGITLEDAKDILKNTCTQVTTEILSVWTPYFKSIAEIVLARPDYSRKSLIESEFFWEGVHHTIFTDNSLLLNYGTYQEAE